VFKAAACGCMTKHGMTKHRPVGPSFVGFYDPFG
jgi:hypothetical protein